VDVCLKDFLPINSWTPDVDGPRWCENGSPQFLIDQSTNRRYWNEPKGVVGTKAFLLTLGTPFVHAIAATINAAEKCLKLISLSHFWMPADPGATHFKARLLEAKTDLLQLIATPFAVLGLELAALYGVFRPYDGRKLYASIERAVYGHFILAPCFQPNPQSHAFGGDPRMRGAF